MKQVQEQENELNQTKLVDTYVAEEARRTQQAAVRGYGNSNRAKTIAVALAMSV